MEEKQKKPENKNFTFNIFNATDFANIMLHYIIIFMYVCKNVFTNLRLYNLYRVYTLLRLV